MATLNYKPHNGQLAIHQKRDVRFRTVCTGRRFGKTLCLAAELLDRGGCDPPSPQETGGYGGARLGRDYGWVAPTYNVAERGIDAFRQIATGFVRVVGRMPTRVEFDGAAGPVRVWFLSADNADNIRGYGFQGLVVDEAAMIPANVWQYVLRPTISQTLGWAVFVSTPKGRNWFYDMHTRGLDPEEKDYASLTFPSSASPYFPDSEWEDARRTLPSDVFRQEYEAEFLEDSAGVFRGVDACLIQTADYRPQTADGGRETEDRRRKTANSERLRGGGLTANWANLVKGDGTSLTTEQRACEQQAAKQAARSESDWQRTEDTEGKFGLTTKNTRNTKALALRRRPVVVGCDVAKHTDFTVLVKLEAVAGKAAVVLPDGDTDLVPFVVLEGAAADANASVRPLEPGRNVRLVLAGTCEPGDVLVLADGSVEADRGKVRVLPVVTGAYRQVAIAEESGVEGSWVLARPVSAVVVDV
jgi:hypothetical protein